MTNVLFKPSEIISRGDETGTYAAFPLRTLMISEEAPVDIYIKTMIAGNPEPQFIICCVKGQVFLEAWYRKLEEMKISWVYCLADEEVHLMRYLNGNLDKILSDHKLENTAKAGMLYDTTLVWIRHLYIEDKQRVGGQLDLALRFIDGLFACLTNKKSNIALILDIMRRDSSLYSHCLNVCLMGLAFSNYLKWTSRDAQAFGLGAILYDIGMSEINQDILQKKGSLNEEEFEEVRRHPMLGFQILKNYAGISWEPLLMSLQHHENGDGSGYPEGLWLNAIHPWARILRILDSYEAMTAEKCWRPAHPPQKALWMMREDWRKSQKYDANYLQAFIKFLAG